MNRGWRWLHFIVAIFALTPVLRAADQTRPNIVVILADDLGYGDLGCFGGTDIPTPHIDSIAHDGVRFTNAYAYPTCSPTRAALMTGQYAERFGISNALMGDDAPKIAAATTIAQRLRDAGYITGLVGKWHLGYSDRRQPNPQRLRRILRLPWRQDRFFQTHRHRPERRHARRQTRSLGRRKTNHARRLHDESLHRPRPPVHPRQRRRRSKPFFLFITYNAPHYAKKDVWQAPDEYLKRFNAVGQTKGRDVYRAMVACLDDGVGEVLAELKAQKAGTATHSSCS